MEKEKIDCYLVFTSDPHQSEYLDMHFKTREYISGFTGSAGWMAVTLDRAILWTDGRYHVQAAEELQGSGIELFKAGIATTQTLPDFLKQMTCEGKCVACDGETISETEYADYEKAIKPGRFRTDLDLFERIWKNRPAMSCKSVYELPLSVCGKSRTEKLTHLRAEMEKRKLQGYFVSDLSALMWLFNIRGADVTCNPVAFSYAYLTLNDAYLFLQTDACKEELKTELAKDGVVILPYEEVKHFLSGLADLLIGLDFKCSNHENVAAIKAHNQVLAIAEEDMIPKHVKNETEIALAKKYHELDAVAMIRFIRWIKSAVSKESVTEYEAAQKIDNLRRENEGFCDLSFDTISAYKENGAIIHYAPKEKGSKTLRPEGFLLLDSGAQYMGATTDITRTIALGALTDEEKRDYTAVLKAVIALASAQFLDGTTGANLDLLARGPIWDLGIDYRHGTGHGIGAFLNVHEGPQNFRYKIRDDVIPSPIVPGMITSDEPGIYIEGSHGIRIENELLCIPALENEWGSFYRFETLTLVPLEKEAIDKSMLREDEIAWINSYHQRVYETISSYLSEEEKVWLAEETAIL